MKIGAIVRAEDRGIGLQVWEFCRAMQPERTLLVDMGELARGFPPHPERYPGATVVHYEHGELVPTATVREWLDGLDVVFCVETFYDWRIPGWARDVGCATVCQVNPEFMRPPEELPSLPTRWWAPTPWRLNLLPPDTRVVPVPVADDRFPFAIPERGQQLRVLHVAGHRAMNDRNGTQLLLQGTPRMGAMHLTVMTQDERRIGVPRSTRQGLTAECRHGGIADYWRLYEDQDVLVMPRRYGGLCLPVQEAMASGLAVVMSDAEPQRSFWPVMTVRTATTAPKHRCPGGRLAMSNARPEAIAEALNTLAKDPEALIELQQASLEWAKAHRWSVMRDLYERELADVAG